MAFAASRIFNAFASSKSIIAGITDIKAKVVSQSIKCESGCPVTEKAVFTTKLWG